MSDVKTYDFVLDYFRDPTVLVDQKVIKISLKFYCQGIDDALWREVREKRKETGIPTTKVYNLERAHLLSGS